MLHLAQVHRQGRSGEAGLRLLARQAAEDTWAVMPDGLIVPAAEAVTLSKGLLVLVELSPTGEVQSLQDATNWVLELIQTYLTSGITPVFLQQEAERAEQWRQDLTLQNQELARRSLELEARREQIQALEESLRLERETLTGQNQELARLSLELEARREQIQALEESLRRDREDLTRRSLELEAPRDSAQA